MKKYTTKISKWHVTNRNPAELAKIAESLYQHGEYNVKLGKADPIILDVGSHVGLSMLYFKDHYPKAKITCFEPNPATFSLMSMNVANNSLDGIRLVNASVGKENGQATLHVIAGDEPWSWGDSLVEKLWGDTAEYEKVTVPQVRLSDYINEPVDLVKIDAEGMETEIVSEMQGKLSLVENLAVEYHPQVSHSINDFQAIVKILEKHGFRTRIKVLKRLMPSELTGLFYRLTKLKKGFQFIFHSSRQ